MWHVCLPRICLNRCALWATGSIERYLNIGSGTCRCYDKSALLYAAWGVPGAAYKQENRLGITGLQSDSTIVRDYDALETADVPTNRLISSTRCLNPFHFALPTRVNGELSVVGPAAVSSFRNGLETDA